MYYVYLGINWSFSSEEKYINWYIYDKEPNPHPLLHSPSFPSTTVPPPPRKGKQAEKTCIPFSSYLSKQSSMVLRWLYELPSQYSLMNVQYSKPSKKDADMRFFFLVVLFFFDVITRLFLYVYPFYLWCYNSTLFVRIFVCWRIICHVCKLSM